MRCGRLPEPTGYQWCTRSPTSQPASGRILLVRHAVHTLLQSACGPLQLRAAPDARRFGRGRARLGAIHQWLLCGISVRILRYIPISNREAKGRGNVSSIFALRPGSPRKSDGLEPARPISRCAVHSCAPEASLRHVPARAYTGVRSTPNRRGRGPKTNEGCAGTGIFPCP
jgi:hypothetical protein